MTSSVSNLIAASRRRVPLLWVCGLLMAGASASALADSSINVQTFAAADGRIDQDNTGSRNGGPGVPSTYTATAIKRGLTGESNGFAFAYAEEGILRVSVSGQAATFGGSSAGASFQSTVFAQFTDVLNVNGGALNGSAGFLTASLIVGGSTGARADLFSRFDSAYADARIGIEGTGFAPTDTSSFPFGNAGVAGYKYGRTSVSSPNPNSGTTRETSNIPAVFDLTIPFTFGSDKLILYRTSVFALATTGSLGAQSAGATAASFADYGQTLQWGGISGIFTAQGVQVDDFTLQSRSGFDYLTAPVAAIPEPSTWAMLIAGLLALGAVVKRGQSPRRVP